MKIDDTTGATPLRQKAENLLNKKSSKGKILYSEDEAAKLIHELEVHQIELELQNEELITATIAAQISSDKYVELYDFAPSGYVTLSAACEIQKLNHACAGMLGNYRSHLINHNFSYFVSADTHRVFKKFFGKVFTGIAKETCEVVLTSKGNLPIYVHIEGVLSENGELCLANLTDITAEKQASELLRKTDHQKKLILEAIGEGILGVDLQGNINFANPMAVEILGYSPIELSGKSSQEIFHHHHQDGTIHYLEDYPVHSAILAGKRIHGEEYFWRKDGTGVPVEFRSLPIVEDHKITGAVVSFRDITTRKQAEEEIRQSEERYKSLFQDNHSVMLLVDPVTGKIKDANPAACRYYGWSYSEMCLKNISEINTLSEDEVIAEMQKAVKEKRNHFFFQHRLANEQVRDVEVYSGPIRFGKSTILYSFVHDITERKLAEQELIKARVETEESEKKFKSIIESQAEGIGFVNKDEVFEFVNTAAGKIFDTDVDELIGASLFDFLNQDERKNISNQTGNRKNGFTDTYDLQIVTKKGNVKYIHITATPKFDENDNYIGAYGVFRDITLRRQAENEAKAISILLANILLNLQEGILLEDPDRKIAFTNQLFCDMLGIPALPEALKGVDCTGSAEQSKTLFKYPDKFISDINLILANKKMVLNDELALVDGRYFERDYIPTYLNDNYNGHLWKYRDITERKQAEEGIRKLSQAVEQSLVMTLITDLSGVIEYVNPKAVELTGYQKEELIGENPLIFSSGERPKEYYKELWETISSGKEWKGEFYNKKKNGDFYWVRASISPVTDDAGIIKHYICVAEDYTQNKVSEEKIKKQNERLNAIIHAMPDLIFVIDKEGTYSEFYSSTPESLTVPDDQIVGLNLKSVFDEESSTRHLQKIKECIEQKKLVNYEYSFDVDNSICFYEARLVPYETDKVLTFVREITDRKHAEDEIRSLNADLEKRIKHRTGELVEINENLINEIFERKRTEDELEESREKYRGLSEASFEAIFFSEKGLCVEQNLAAETMFGYTTEEALVRYGTEWIVPEDREMVMNNMLAGLEGAYEATALRKDGTTFPCVLRGKMMHYKGRNVRVTSLNDITERKQAEEEVKQVSARLALATRVGGVGVWDFDIVNNTLIWDDQMLALYGIRKEEFLGAYEAWQAGLHPDDRARGDAEIQMAISGEKEFNSEFRVVWPEGTIRNIEALAIVQRDDSGKAVRMIGTNWDITERKRSQAFESELLQLSLQLTGLPGTEISAALDIALSRIGSFLAADRAYLFELNPKDNTMSNTHEWCNIGILPEIENLQDIPYDILPMWMETLRRHENIIIRSVNELPGTWQAEREILEPQGIQSLLVIPILNENNLIGFVGLDSVRTKKEYEPSEINILQVWGNMLGGLINNQRIEGFLDQTRRNYETFFNTIDDFLFVLDEQGNIIHTNTTVINRLNYTRQELLGKSVLTVHPPDRRDEAARIVSEMLGGSSDFCPVPIITKSGVLIPVETRVKQGMWNDKPAIFGVVKDISRIQLSEEKFSKVFYLNPSACGLSDLFTGKYVEVNEAFYTLFGFGKDEVIDKTAYELNILDDDLKNIILQHADSSGSIRNAEANLRAKNGDILHVLLSAENITIQEKTYLYTVVHNITDRVEAEKNLRESEENIAEAQHIAHIGSWNWDIILDTIQFSKEMYLVLDISPDTFDAKPESLIKVIHPADVNLFNTSMAGNLSGTDKSPFEYRVIHKDGSIHDIYARVRIEFDMDARPIRSIGTMQDITERKIAEKEKSSLEQLQLLARHTEKVRENERISISRELHDDLGQALTAVKIDLGIIKQKVPNKDVALKINKVTALVTETIKTVQRITARLRPEIIEDLGIEAAIQWYTKEFEQRYGVEISLDMDSEILINPDIALILFRIMQESLTNVARHSKATKVDIGLCKNGDQINFWISDNGIGITKEQIKAKKSFGVMGMMERATSLGGTLDIHSENSRGTVIMLKMPLFNN